MTETNSAPKSGWRVSLPLLAKELIELAARKRTYIVRVVYAVLLFASGYLISKDVFDGSNGNAWSLMGKGRELFDRLIGLQFAGIYLFMPAMACSVITQEKERDSLMLLFLTKLDPWTIVLEKLLSRMIPMFCFLLLSLPMLAIAYSLGGINLEYLLGGILALSVTVLQAGTFAVFCSTYFRTTVRAFLGSYILGFLLIFGPGIVVTIFSEILGDGRGDWTNNSWIQFLVYTGIIAHGEQLLLLFFTPVHFFEFGPWGASFSIFKFAGRCIPLFLWSWVFMNWSQKVLVSRAFVPPSNVLLAIWKKIDSFFSRINQNRITKGIVLIRDTGSIPDNAPISWRETTKRSLGRTRYLVRLLITVESIVLTTLFLGASVASDAFLPLTTMSLFLVWILHVLLVTVSASSLIAGERTHQTLDVLCITPLTSRDILEQKFHSCSRLILTISIPLFSVIIFDSFWRAQFSRTNFGLYGDVNDVPLYIVGSILAAFVYPRTLAWMSFWIGLMTRTQVRAMMISMATITAWCVVPFLLDVLISSPFNFNSDANIAFRGFINVINPAAFLGSLYGNELFNHPVGAWIVMIMNLLFMTGLWMFFKAQCLWRAAHWLGRSEVTMQRRKYENDEDLAPDEKQVPPENKPIAAVPAAGG